jgi:hypothetical protein
VVIGWIDGFVVVQAVPRQSGQFPALHAVPDPVGGRGDQFIRLTCSDPGRPWSRMGFGQARCRALEDDRQVTITLEIDLIVKTYSSLS